jgi:predicted nucleic acid-binding protein
MITALDSSVILDVLTNDSRFSEKSATALRRASAEGKLIVCDCVIAEIFPVFVGKDKLDEFLKDWNLEFQPLDLPAAVVAGSYFATYLSRGGSAKRVIPDFLVGAHAVKHADRLLARDRGYLKDYFKELSIWDPSSG